MRNLVRIMSIAALVALVVVACDQHAVEPAKSLASEGSFAKDEAAALLVVDCETCCGDGDDVLGFGPVGGASVGSYCGWTAQQYNFCEEGDPQIQFEGQFGSFVRGINGWNVDLVPTGSENWCDIVDDIVYEHANAGTAPTCNALSPDNVVGANGTLFGQNYGSGYYTYNPTTNQVSSYNFSILVWKDCDADETEDVSTADVAYVLTVNPVSPAPGAGGTFTSSVTIAWSCVAITTCE
jgi:hypothetical protein